jgi:hypothetical protein
MAATRKTTTTKSATVEVTLELSRETPGTFRFDAADKDAVITSLYVKKSGFPNGAPATVKLTIESV